MCNAWNHPPDCTCGWGGEGHLGKRTEWESYSTKFVIFDKTKPRSYVNPNAICPVCGCHVFFYKSPYGGKVYFDDLGPPWPKHPCTDNKSFDNYFPELIIEAYTNNYVFTKQPVWTENRWHPVFLESSSQKSAHAFYIIRLDVNPNIYMEIKIHGTDAIKLKERDLLIFAKRIEKNYFLLSAYDTNKNLALEFKIKCNETTLDSFFRSNS